MRQRWKVLLVAACGLVAVVAVCFFCLREKEPSYNGRPLSEWLDALGPPPYGMRSTQRREQAATAVRAIGTNAVPFLLTWFDSGNQMVRLLPGNDSLIHRATDPLLLHFERQRQRGVIGFNYLGASASAAIPQLALRFANAKSTNDAMLIGNILRNMGDDGFNVFIGVVTNGLPMQRRLAINYVLWMSNFLGYDAKPAIPALLKVAQDSHDPISGDATKAVGSLGVDSDDVIAMLTNKLTFGAVPEKKSALAALLEMGVKARPALPAVEIALYDADVGIRYRAAEVVAKIARDSR